MGGASAKTEDIGDDDPVTLAEACGPPMPGWVYFIGFAHYVKIGFTSKSVVSRLADLQVGAPMKLVVFAAIVGDREDEQILHFKFYKQRLHGEWFYHRGRLKRFIAELPRSHPPVDIGHG